MEIKLEKGLAIPPKVTFNPQPSETTIALREALKAMEVGDSFQLDSPKLVSRIRTEAKSLGVKIACRVIKSEKGEHVAVRCWRME